MELHQEVLEFIHSNSEAEKAKFDASIFKTDLKVYGVRTNVLRKKAKELAKRDDFKLPLHSSYEMDFLLGVTYAYKKIDLKEKLDFYQEFFKGVDNWAIVDGVASSMNLKSKDYPIVKEFFLLNYNSQDVFLVRFCYMLYLHNYTSNEHIDEILTYIKKEGPYYILMVEAWLLANAFLIEKNKIYAFLNTLDKNSDLFKFTKRKLLDSYRVLDDDKLIIRRMK